MIPLSPSSVALSFLRVHWVAVPKAVRARRVNISSKERTHVRTVTGDRPSLINGAPCGVQVDSQAVELRHCRAAQREWERLRRRVHGEALVEVYYVMHDSVEEVVAMQARRPWGGDVWGRS
jgi:hypothetical protein